MLIVSKDIGRVHRVWSQGHIVKLKLLQLLEVLHHSVQVAFDRGDLFIRQA